MAGTRLKRILKYGSDLKRVENSTGTKLKQLEKFFRVVGKFWKIQGLIGKCWAAEGGLGRTGLLGFGQGRVELTVAGPGWMATARPSRMTGLGRTVGPYGLLGWADANGPGRSLKTSNYKELLYLNICCIVAFFQLLSVLLLANGLNVTKLVTLPSPYIRLSPTLEMSMTLLSTMLGKPPPKKSRRDREEREEGYYNLRATWRRLDSDSDLRKEKRRREERESHRVKQDHRERGGVRQPDGEDDGTGRTGKRSCFSFSVWDFYSQYPPLRAYTLSRALKHPSSTIDFEPDSSSVLGREETNTRRTLAALDILGLTWCGCAHMGSSPCRPKWVFYMVSERVMLPHAHVGSHNARFDFEVAKSALHVNHAQEWSGPVPRWAKSV
ncbi:hypothetical protein CRG98_025545 [Punica granatum]|uniref:Uncharacterized protein n=1 Tax=Punica granatum TaxID=22663 RepID=A0A2I0JCS5_PUNGR|nr:hypothetical protein CRG98_025545 [Punica granatum]